MKDFDLMLEAEELISYDMKTGIIKVDKDIFDDFVENFYINIKFVEDESNEVYEFTMLSEDDDGIIMEYRY